jgi:multidrug efflux pump subunit AcrA (membrane-fusion protein)
MRAVRLWIFLATATAACHQAARQPTALPSTAATRRTIVARVQATGTLEPIDLISIRSKASGAVLKMPVDIGSEVKAGDLIVQIDPRNVQSTFDGAVADDVASVAAMHNAELQKKRAEEMLAQHVITPAEHDSVAAAYVSAMSVVAEDRARRWKMPPSARRWTERFCRRASRSVRSSRLPRARSGATPRS